MIIKLSIRQMCVQVLNTNEANDINDLKAVISPYIREIRLFASFVKTTRSYITDCLYLLSPPFEVILPQNVRMVTPAKVKPAEPRGKSESPV